jgi:acyl-ACP thioesterase
MNPTDNSTPPAVWQQEFMLHSYDVDFKKSASLETVCRYFLEGAWNHAEALSVGFQELANRGQLWVLSRFLVNIQSYPNWGDTITVRTWPRHARSVFAMRDFRLVGPTGQIMATGSSAWLVLDRKTRKPQRIDRIAEQIRATSAERATERDPAKLPALAAHQPGMNIHVRYSDVDVNGHVNSCRYVSWLLDTYPLEWHQQHQALALEVNYLGETLDGDQLGLDCDRSPTDGHLFSLTSLKGGREVCRARLLWQRLGSKA